MGRSGTPLGIGLGIDFAKLDADLARVADKIEEVGSKASLKVGTFAGLASKGGINSDQLGAQVSQVGVQLSQGVASGVRASSAVILAMGARMNAMLDRLAGTAITMFQRIDAAMKFPRWDTLMTRMRLGLSNFAAGAPRAMTAVDVAMSGGFGRIAQTAAKILKPLFEQIGASIAPPIEKAIAGLGPMMEAQANLMAEAMKRAAYKIETSMTFAIDHLAEKLKGLRSAGEASASALMAGFQPTGKYMSQGAGRFSNRKRPSESSVAGYFGSLKPGQRDELLEPPPPPKQFAGARPAPQMLSGYAQALKDIIALGQKASGAFASMATSVQPFASFVARSTVLLGQTLLTATRLGAGITSVFLGGAQAVYRFQNFMSSLGSVSKRTFSDIYASHGLFVGSLLGSIKLVKMLGGALIDIVTLRAFRRVGEDAGMAANSIRATTGMVGKLAGSVGRLGVELAAAFGFFGVAYKLVGFFRSGISGAAELNDTMATSKVVFGASFGAIESHADAVSKKYGVLRNEQIAIANQFGEMAQGAGIAEDASAKLANRLTEVALDLSRSAKIPFSEAAEHIRTGLAGRGQALKQYGVFLDDDAIKARALADGLGSVASSAGKAHRQLATHVKVSHPAKGFSTVDKVGKAPKAGGGGGAARLDVDLSKAAEVGIRADMIMKGLGYTMGALERTSGGAASQFQKAGGGIGEFGVRLGEVLIPAVQVGAEAFNTLLASILDAFEQSSTAITGWGETLKAKMEDVGMFIRNFGSFWTIAQLKAGEFMANTLAYIEVLPENFGRITGWLGRNWSNLLVDMGNMLMSVGTSIIANAANLGQAVWDAIQGKDWHMAWVPLLEGFKATAEAFPEMIKPKLISVADEVAKITDEIGRKESMIKKPAVVPPPKKPGPIEEPAMKAGGDYKLAAAVEVGSKEASSIIARSLSPGARLKDPAKEGAKLHRDGNKILGDIAANTRKPAGPSGFLIRIQ